MAIRTLGFRGEALPSIGAAARLTITTRHADEPHAWSITVDAGEKSEVKPAALGKGTTVEVRDLFYATPARLKFLKTDRSEAEAVREVVRRLAMSRPDVSFTLAGEERAPMTWGAAAGGDELARLGDVLGPDFRANAVAIDAEREGVRVTGFAGLPTLSRANSLGQYLFVNGRPVRDKLLFGAVRAAYADYLPRDRHPVLALSVSLDPREVDVNVHPAKTEVRFRDGALVRGLIVRALKDALMREGQRAATTGGSATIATFRPAAVARRGSYDWRRSPARPAGFAPIRGGLAEVAQAAFDVGEPAADAAIASFEPAADQIDRPLGAARAQLHETYIVAQTRDGLVIVDQHAAHERIVYERMKAALEKSGVARQILLIPEIVELDEADAARLSARAEDLARFGLVIESVRPRRRRGARDSVDARRGRCEGLDRRSRPAHGGMGRLTAAGAASHARFVDHGLPWLGTRRAQAQAGGDERPAARDEVGAQFRPVQSRPADLCRAEADRYRAAVRQAVDAAQVARKNANSVSS